MHKWFAFSAIAVLGATLIMMAKDESREWRVYQSRAEDLRVEKIENDKKKLESQKYVEERDKLQARKADAQKRYDEALASTANEPLIKEYKELKTATEILAVQLKFQNAERDVARANFDLAVRDAKPQSVLDDLQKKFNAEQEESDAIARTLEAKKLEFDRKRADYNKLSEELGSIDAELVKFTADEKVLNEQQELLAPTSKFRAAKRSFKEWPIINGFNPHLKIQYDWPAGLDQGLGMKRVGRVDRCRSCHVNIGDFGPGDVANYPDDEYHQPFSGHPNPSLFLTSTSPHPMEKFGCTVCHEGDGSGTSFQNAEHSPASPAQADKWSEEHHWHSNHFWEYPMFPKPFLEATCIRCHHSVTELGVNEKFGASAPKVFEGYNLIREFGCFGCHEINGYDGTRPIGPDMRGEPATPEEAAKIAADPNAIPGTLRKVGPSLRHVAQKTSESFIASWTKDPKAFRPTTRMPKFFDETNQHDALAAKLQPVELAAIATFLTSKSTPIAQATPNEGYTPDAARGKFLFARRGCLACHSYPGDEELAGAKADFGPELSRIHEKLLPGEAGFKWLYNWLREPEKYHTRTKMPDLFLDPYKDGDKEIDPAADIAAFLLQKGTKELPPLDKNWAPALGVVGDADFSAEKAASLSVPHEGVLVQEVLQGSAASRARTGSEVKPLEAGDVVLKIGSDAATSPEQLDKLFAARKPGETVTLSIISKGQSVTREVIASNAVDDLTRFYLTKAGLTSDKVEAIFKNRRVAYPEAAKTPKADGTLPSLKEFIKGDEVELVAPPEEAEVSEEAWKQRQLVFLGKRTIGRYGCFGCHDISGFEDGKPIGPALTDWGRKDTSKLAPEHIEEYLHHHGERDGSSTFEKIENILGTQKSDGNVPELQLTEALLFESLLHHGRPGFIWQKLRDPRSYDYEKTASKGWDERLRMPNFYFDQKQIEAISTFVLGLVADPPAEQFQFRPTGAKLAIVEGERLLEKFNCTGCHMVDLPEFQFATTPEEFPSSELSSAQYPQALDLLMKIKPPINGDTGRKTPAGEPIARVRGMVLAEPDPEELPEDQILTTVAWTPVKAFDKTLYPSVPVQIPVPKLISRTKGRGGDFAMWLAGHIKNDPGVGDNNRALQASPPPLYREGWKVQTPWLYQFLKNPEQVRYTTVLRMPRFNLDDNEAQTLANYFAAIDGAPFPYQSVPQNTPAFTDEHVKKYAEAYPDSKDKYDLATWKVINSNVCRQCHQVGGNAIVGDPKQVVRGPNLERVSRRLRPDWLELWIASPPWVTPYTSMPVNFPADKKSMADLFGGNGWEQIQGAVYGLVNYQRVLEAHGQLQYVDPAAAAAAAAAAAPADPNAPKPDAPKPQENN
jgi:cytochrome c2